MHKCSSLQRTPSAGTTPVYFSAFAAWTEREIDASAGTLSGRSEATAGKVLGIVGTVLLTLVVAAFVLLVVLTFTQPDLWDDESTTDTVLGLPRQVDR